MTPEELIATLKNLNPVVIAMLERAIAVLEFVRCECDCKTGDERILPAVVDALTDIAKLAEGAKV